MKKSEAERLLFDALNAVGLKPEPNYRFTPSRLWGLDLAFPEIKLAIEVDGSGIGHTSDKGKRQDCEKRNAAIELGWRVLQYPAREVTVKKRLPRIAAQIERIIYGEEDGDEFNFVLERDPQYYYKTGKGLWRKKNAKQLSRERQQRKDLARKRANEKRRKRKR